jgi:hypothetical protein
MGQTIKVDEPTIIGEVALFATDRGITGQAGEVFDRTSGDDSFPGRLAAAVFAADDAVGHVFIASNQVTTRRDGGWEEAAVAAVTGAIEQFFVFYDEESG